MGGFHIKLATSTMLLRLAANTSPSHVVQGGASSGTMNEMQTRLTPWEALGCWQEGGIGALGMLTFVAVVLARIVRSQPRYLLVEANVN